MKQKIHSWITLLSAAVLTAALLCGCRSQAEDSSDGTSAIESAGPGSESTSAPANEAEITVFDGADHFSVPSLTFLDSSIDLIGWLIGG